MPNCNFYSCSREFHQSIPVSLFSCQHVHLQIQGIAFLCISLPGLCKSFWSKGAVHTQVTLAASWLRPHPFLDSNAKNTCEAHLPEYSSPFFQALGSCRVHSGLAGGLYNSDKRAEAVISSSPIPSPSFLSSNQNFRKRFHSIHRTTTEGLQ